MLWALYERLLGIDSCEFLHSLFACCRDGNVGIADEKEKYPSLFSYIQSSHVVCESMCEYNLIVIK